MSGRCIAFPVLDRSNVALTHMASLSRAVLPRLRDTLLRRCQCPRSETTSVAMVTTPPVEEGLLHCTLSIGPSVTVPLTVLGCLSDESPMSANEVFVHSPGLAGAFPVAMDDLASCRGRLQLSVAEGDYDGRGTSPAGNDSSRSVACELGMVCLMEALQKGGATHSVLQRLYRIGRRRHFSVRGATRVMQRGARLNVAALRCEFPYHVGGAQASKEYFDIRDEVCDVFDAVTMRHGTKVLSRYGVAVSVGVRAQGGAVVRTPSLLWHPTGASAACLAMVLHGCRLLPLDVVKLEYNGPTSLCPLLHTEDARRYMQVDQGMTYDRSTWLCMGLFGHTPDQPWRHTSGQGEGHDGDVRVVAGVTYDTEDDEFELVLRDTATGALTLADDVAHDAMNKKE